jgi:Spy/CpxP family protein refolding chaperone
MRKTAVVIVVLLLAAVAVAQETAPAPAQGVPRTPRPAMPGLAMPGMEMFHPPAALQGEFWKDPALVADLHLTQAQISALEQASLNTKLAAIDSGAGALKSFVQLQALLNADQVDQAAYNAQLAALSTAADKLIKDFGGMALTVRKTLTADQWHKLEALRAERRAMRPRAPQPPREPRRPRDTPNPM